MSMAIRTADADPITLMWDPNPSAEEVLGYVVYVSQASVVIAEYDVGSQTDFVYPDAVAGAEYSFAVAAYNVLGVGPSTELTGFSNAPPDLVNPGNQVHAVGEPVTLQLDGSDRYGEPVSYLASGLPPGITLAESTGVISGAGTTAGTYPVTATVFDGLLSTPRAFTWFIDALLPTVTITMPSAQATYATDAIAIPLGGTAGDNVGVSSVTWVNSGGGTGVATLTTPTTWVIPVVPLAVGANVITVTVHDLAGNTRADVITVTSSGAGIPSVQINFPAPGPSQVTSDSTTPMFGGASDITGVTSVTWTTDRGGSGTAQLFSSPGVAFWTVAAVPLEMGMNVITVTAWNALGISGNAVLAVERLPALVTAMVTASSKAYDGTASATLAGCTLSVVVDGDVVGCTGAAAFDTAIVGTGKTVTVTGLTLTGPAASHYSLATTGATTTAAITALTVTPVAAVSDKPYDGTTSATLTSCTVIGAIGGDAVACTGTPAFGTAIVGTGKTVTVTGLTLTGSAAGNYALTTTTDKTTAAILPLAVTPVVTVADKPYDGTTGATLTSCTVSGTLEGDAVACTGMAAFGSATVGTGKDVTVNGLVLTGAAAGSYALTTTTATTTATITLLLLTPTVTAPDKPYDGTTGATLTSCTLSGTLVGDAVDCTGGPAAFGSAGVGTAKTVTVTGLTLAGAAAGNYALTTTTDKTTAAITPRMVTPQVMVSDKPHSGTIGATITSCTVSGTIGGDVVGCTGTASFDTASVGTGKTVRVSGLTLTGAAAVNYALATTDATTTAAIRGSNEAPVITNPGPQGGFQGVALALTMPAVDADNDPLAWSAQNLPPGIAINPSTGTLSGTPTTLGTFPTSISASDGGATAQASFGWTIASPLPGRAAPGESGVTATATPTFSWPAVPLATYYALSITDAAAASPILAWYTPEQAGCADGTGTCTVTAPRALASGLVSWKVLTWNSHGYGPWSTTVNIVVDLADLSVPIPTAVGPSGSIGTRTPTYSWHTIGDATWYQVSVTDAIGTAREFWYSPAVACDTTPCGETPNALLAIGPAQWRVRAWRATGAGPWTEPVNFEAVDAAPGKATLVSPTAPVSSATPTFTWNAVLGTSYYLLRVTDRDNTTIERWYRPGDTGCHLGTGICSASLGEAINPGPANWLVLTWNGSGYGPWSDPRNFSVEVPDPSASTPATIGPTGVISTPNATYTWTAVAGITSYRLSIRSNGGPPSYWWYSPAGAGCAVATECSVTPQAGLQPGTAEWQVQGWTTTGHSAWSAPVALTVSVAAPAQPSLVSPGGAAAGAPSFVWNATARVTLYYVRVEDPVGKRVDRWLTPAQAGCSSGTGVCTLNAGVTLNSGAGSWAVIAWNASGYSPWSSTMGFVVP